MKSKWVNYDNKMFDMLKANKIRVFFVMKILKKKFRGEILSLR